jgi:hypothetical protein
MHGCRIILAQVAVISPFICGLVAIIQFKKLSLDAKIICILVFMGATTEAIARYSVYLYKSNHAVYSLNYLLELILIYLYYCESIPIMKRRRLKSWGILTFIGIAFVNATLVEPNVTLKQNFAMYSSITIISLSLVSLYYIVVEMKDRPMTYNVNFWIASTIMIFNLLNFPYLGLYNVVLENRYSDANLVLQILHHSTVILYYLALAIVLAIAPNLQKKYSISSQTRTKQTL